jgi:hypothetical protein
MGAPREARSLIIDTIKHREVMPVSRCNFIQGERDDNGGREENEKEKVWEMREERDVLEIIKI